MKYFSNLCGLATRLLHPFAIYSILPFGLPQKLTAENRPASGRGAISLLVRSARAAGWALAAMVAAPNSHALSPANPNLIPEARDLLDYLESIYGENCLAAGGGVSVYTYIDKSDRYPAIQNFDLSGWYSVKWDPAYERNIGTSIEEAILWHAEGGIVTFTFHWPNPLGTSGLFKDTQAQLTVEQLQAIVTPGTAEYTAMIEDLDKHAAYLQRLSDLNIPVLWRPLHEIDGGWFWWTDDRDEAYQLTNLPDGGNYTAELFRIVYDRLTNYWHMNNLIWIYAAALRPPVAAGDPAHVAWRKKYYPGDAYVDFAGIDMYQSTYLGIGPSLTDNYQQGWDIISQVCPGKMYALCESAGYVDPGVMATNGPKWLYNLPWYAPDDGRNPEWRSDDFLAHAFVVTRDELPWSDNRLVDPNFQRFKQSTTSGFKENDGTMTQEYVNKGWYVANSSRWVHYSTTNSGTDAKIRMAKVLDTTGAQCLVQAVYDNYRTAGYQPVSFNAKNTENGGGANTLQVKVYGVNGNFALNEWDNSDVGTVLYNSGNVGGTTFDWSEFSARNVDFGSGYQYIVVKVYIDGVDPAVGDALFVDDFEVGVNNIRLSLEGSIDFEGLVAGTISTSIAVADTNSDDWDFNAVAGNVKVYTDIGSKCVGAKDNYDTFRFSRADGLPFSLASLDIMNLTWSSHTYTITGHRAGGETVTRTVSMTSRQITNLVFDSSWSDLVTVEFDHGVNGRVAIDNVEFD